MLPTQSVLANGNINPSRFVMIDVSVTTGWRAIQATAASLLIVGVSQEGSKLPPLEGFTNTLAAEADDPFEMFPYMSTALIFSGAAITIGALVTSDANGKAVAATSGQLAWGRAFQSAGGADEKVHIQVLPGVNVP